MTMQSTGVEDDGCQHLIADLNYVFQSGLLQNDATFQMLRNNGNQVNTFHNFITTHVEAVQVDYWRNKVLNVNQQQSQWNKSGRVGPTMVSFRPNCYGRYEARFNPMGVIAKDDFSSVIAKTGVCSGQWQYEVNIGSGGVMQVGWATSRDNFNGQKGVGDTANSYSYDGNRQRSWNIHCSQYGQVWQTGDVISCFIDLDHRTISYSRNGTDMGIAFSDLDTGPKFVYYPAVSLAKDEYLKVNFGETPLLYPKAGHHPLQPPPALQLHVAAQSLQWLNRIMDLLLPITESRRRRSVLSSLYQLILRVVLRPLLLDSNTSNYVVQAALLPALTAMLPPQLMVDQPADSLPTFPSASECPGLRRLHLFLDWLHSLLQSGTLTNGVSVAAPKHAGGHDLELLLSRLLLLPLLHCRQPAEDRTFGRHKQAVTLIGALLTHRPTRLVAVSRLLFTECRLQNMLCLSVDEPLIRKLVPDVYWTQTAVSSIDATSPCVQATPMSRGDKQKFEAALHNLDKCVEDVERLHCAVISLLLTVEPGDQYSASTRALFLRQLRHSLIKAKLNTTKYNQPTMMPLFNCLLSTLGVLWRTELPCSRRHCLPLRLYYGDHLDCLGANRLGGVDTFLDKELALHKIRAIEEDNTNQQSASGRCACQGSSDEQWFGCCKHQDALASSTPRDRSLEDSPMEVDCNPGNVYSGASGSLLEFADCVVLFYHCCAHRTLVRAGIARDVINQHIDRLAQIVNLHNSMKINKRDQRVLDSLDRSACVVGAECERLVAVQAWHRVLYFAPRKLGSLVNLLQLTLNTVQTASGCGAMFAFLPDYLLETLTELSMGLAEIFYLDNFTVSAQPALFSSVARFITLHFMDPRIRYTDSVEVLMTTLANLVTNPSTLRVLEDMDSNSRNSLVRNLFQSYTNRLWAPNNWVLVRLWKGSGFAYRHYHSPHLKTVITPKPAFSDTGVQLIKASPSLVLQRTIQELLQTDSAYCSAFLSSLLDQLNWAFSEFIMMMQEIKSYCNRQERVFIDSRQLRLCCTCFDLAVSLLRVVEMVLTLHPAMFTHHDRPQSDLLLSMLCKMVCHVVNRVSVSGAGCFSHVTSLEIPGLDQLHFFPILAAAAGVLTALLCADLKNKDNPQDNFQVCNALVTEPSFELRSFEVLLDYVPTTSSTSTTSMDTADELHTTAQGHAPGTAAAALADSMRQSAPVKAGPCKPPFSLRNYTDDVSAEEILLLEQSISLLRYVVLRPSQPTPADGYQECVICYARRATASFHPCGHNSCPACVNQYLMNHKDCFFCLMPIQSVKDELSGSVIFVTAVADSDESGATGTDVSMSIADAGSRVNAATHTEEGSRGSAATRPSVSSDRNEQNNTR